MLCIMIFSVYLYRVWLCVSWFCFVFFNVVVCMYSVLSAWICFGVSCLCVYVEYGFGNVVCCSLCSYTQTRYVNVVACIRMCCYLCCYVFPLYVYILCDLCCCLLFVCWYLSYVLGIFGYCFWFACVYIMFVLWCRCLLLLPFDLHSACMVWCVLRSCLRRCIICGVRLFVIFVRMHIRVLLLWCVLCLFVYVLSLMCCLLLLLGVYKFCLDCSVVRWVLFCLYMYM